MDGANRSRGAQAFTRDEEDPIAMAQKTREGCTTGLYAMYCSVRDALAMSYDSIWAVGRKT